MSMKKTLSAISFALLASQANAAIEEGKLVIWIGGDKGYNGLQEVGDRFAKDLGVQVEVAHPDKITDKFVQAAATGNGPDIFIWAHDRFGEWAKSGLISEVKPSQATISSVADFTWDAMLYDGKIYGYPLAMEAVSLIYNKDLIATPPKTFEEMVAIDAELSKKGKKAILWDYNNTYFSWGLFAGAGAYPFKKTDSGYEISDTGVNNAGGNAAAGLIKNFIDQGLMPKGADYGVMDAAFNKGEVAMMINGPWAWSNLKASNINFGVAPLPSLNGKTSKPFVGVLAATINAASPNQDLAVEFLENYLMQVDGIRTMNNDVPLGAVANTEYMEELSANKNIQTTFLSASIGNPMPNIPEMGVFWSSMEAALKNITSGRQSVNEALDGAAVRIAK